MRQLLGSISMWVLGAVADLWSTGLSNPGFAETNPFWRNPAGNLWRAHALIHCGFQSVELAFASVAAYIVGRCIGPRVALAAACTPWAFEAVGHFNAATSNLMMHLKLWIPLNF